MSSKQQSTFQDLDAESLYSGEYLSVATVQADYSLSASEHVVLKNKWVSAYGWALNVGFATFGYFLSIFPKLVAYLESSTNPAIAKGEWLALGFGAGLTVFLCLIGLLCPNEKRALMKAIDKHFADAPKVRRRVGG